MTPALEYALQTGTGIFSVLFICLLAWVLKTNNDRERRYQRIIEENQQVISEVMTSLKDDVSDIKRWIEREVR